MDKEIIKNILLDYEQNYLTGIMSKKEMIVKYQMSNHFLGRLINENYYIYAYNKTKVYFNYLYDLRMNEALLSCNEETNKFLSSIKQ